MHIIYSSPFVVAVFQASKLFNGRVSNISQLYPICNFLQYLNHIVMHIKVLMLKTTRDIQSCRRLYSPYGFSRARISCAHGRDASSLLLLAAFTERHNRSVLILRKEEQPSKKRRAEQTCPFLIVRCADSKILYLGYSRSCSCRIQCLVIIDLDICFVYAISNSAVPCRS
jgi:hypothetical protein